ncbi:MAG: GrpE protein [Patescibacteria group bacterium]|jgi:molecular chaperone GrpE|nr:GrpE protein [Patescibacteria group bacterium]
MSKKEKHEEAISEATQMPEETSVTDTQPEEDYKEKWQRALADMENLRKRTEQERVTFAKYSSESFIEELLPVVDNFYRATEHVPAEQQGSPWVTGIQYIQKNLLDVLEQRGVKEIAAKPGDAFNPSQHEALSSVEDSEQPEDTIVQVIGRGYLLHDKVLKPAQVIVSKHSK